ncbi:lactate dehydrogenase-like 2-hydroxyacid dehydrogenase [Flavobacterium nitrogenifigens]|uniref:Glyoxylate/hydroxypyruvate reductase B n=2 Tax=Flavobacterium TaxID=237 RepID=A0A7W7J1T0_9FLAO|nr:MULTISPECIES: D-glycerate dehydrogenase [Flavobacterium]MBB4804475.1 lactate dehydrogenase-like 2-hydroxyacid dehydrogenase [Flavobacterium nitrogenifigens]MBB6389397.1 lactate dehydrogenase-like 2-hydroxyacid dehydrogenase [Flavobacterium notoginsengisoli]
MNVFINKNIPEAGIKLLQKKGINLTINPTENVLSREEFIKICQQNDALLSVGTATLLDEDFFKKCPNLKGIALFSVGFDSVHIPSANSRKIPVGNTPDVLSRATSDVAFLLMQSVARKSFFNNKRILNDEWGSFNPLANLGQELYGKTLGIFGLGRIGFEMAQKCKAAFGMNIIYHNRSRKEDAEKELDAKYVDFETLLAESDILSVHANYTAENNELFNKNTFAKMKPNSIFINTARGKFQNEDDLFDALTKNIIWGAGLDVTNPEPMKSSNPLLSLPNCCILPHIGSATYEARNGMAICAAQNIIALFENKKMPFCVNEEVYF